MQNAGSLNSGIGTANPDQFTTWTFIQPQQRSGLLNIREVVLNFPVMQVTTDNSVIDSMGRTLEDKFPLLCELLCAANNRQRFGSVQV